MNITEGIEITNDEAEIKAFAVDHGVAHLIAKPAGEAPEGMSRGLIVTVKTHPEKWAAIVVVGFENGKAKCMTMITVLKCMGDYAMFWTFVGFLLEDMGAKELVKHTQVKIDALRN